MGYNHYGGNRGKLQFIIVRVGLNEEVTAKPRLGSQGVWFADSWKNIQGTGNSQRKP